MRSTGRIVLAVLRRWPGGVGPQTDAGLAAWLRVFDVSPAAARGARRRLKHRGLVKCTGRKRRNPKSGRYGRLWLATQDSPIGRRCP